MAPPTSRVAAWMPAGMLDWPGRVAVTVFVSGCNLRCPYCHNPSLLTPSDSLGTWPELCAYIERRRSWIDGLVLTGGEPTCDPQLVPLLETFAALNVPVKLDTNGMEPDVLARILKRKLVSYVALDVKALPAHYQRFTGPTDAEERLTESIRLITRSGVDSEFRTTCYPDVVSRDDLVQIARMLVGGDRYVLQQFRPDTTLSPKARIHAPWDPTELLQIARECDSFIPTSTRGI